MARIPVQPFSLFLVIGCQWDLQHPGVLSFFRMFFQFLTSSTLPHIPTVLFHLLSSSSAPFYFLCVTSWNLEEKDTMHPSLLSHGVRAKLQVSCWWLSLLLKLSWHSFILAFFRNRSRAVIQRPLGHLSFGSGLLYPLSSHLACAFQAALSSTHPLPHLPVVTDPFQQQRRKVESVSCCEPRNSTIHLFRGESF